MKFSIVIPVYNAAPFLEACLNSVVVAAQRCFDVSLDAEIEVVCVDDGSSDGSGQILDRFSANSGCLPAAVVFRVLHQQNAGVSAARNAALKEATGDYICFVDADDVVQPEWLLNYARLAEKTHVDLIRLGGADRVVAEGEIRTWLWRVFVLDGYPWKYCIRRTVARQAEFPVGVAMSEDSIYAARVSGFIRSAAETGTASYSHIVRPDSAMFRRLSSAERLKFLECLNELGASGHDVDGLVVSKLVASGLIAWMSRPADVEMQERIRRVWLNLRTKGWVKTGDAPRLFRFPYEIYALTGSLELTRIWSDLVRRLVAVKRWFSK